MLQDPEQARIRCSHNASKDGGDSCRCLRFEEGGGRREDYPGLGYSWKILFLKQGANQRQPLFSHIINPLIVPQFGLLLYSHTSSSLDDACYDRIEQLRRRASLKNLVHEVWENRDCS